MGVALKHQSILQKALNSLKLKDPKKGYATGNITIITEEEAGGGRASEMFKLEEEYLSKEGRGEGGEGTRANSGDSGDQMLHRSQPDRRDEEIEEEDK